MNKTNLEVAAELTKLAKSLAGGSETAADWGAWAKRQKEIEQKMEGAQSQIEGSMALLGEALEVVRAVVANPSAAGIGDPEESDRDDSAGFALDESQRRHTLNEVKSLVAGISDLLADEQSLLKQLAFVRRTASRLS